MRLGLKQRADRSLQVESKALEKRSGYRTAKQPQKIQTRWKHQDQLVPVCDWSVWPWLPGRGAVSAMYPPATNSVLLSNELRSTHTHSWSSDQQLPYLIDSTLSTIQEGNKKPSTAGFVSWLYMAWQNFTYVLVCQENQGVRGVT